MAKLGLRADPAHGTGTTSALVDRLIAARDDAVKQRVHQLLLAQPDDRLKTGLGLNDEEISRLRRGKLMRSGSLGS
jgi:hypothetical protein